MQLFGSSQYIQHKRHEDGEREERQGPGKYPVPRQAPAQAPRLHAAARRKRVRSEAIICDRALNSVLCAREVSHPLRLVSFGENTQPGLQGETNMRRWLFQRLIDGHFGLTIIRRVSHSINQPLGQSVGESVGLFDGPGLAHSGPASPSHYTLGVGAVRICPNLHILSGWPACSGVSKTTCLFQPERSCTVDCT